MPQQRTKSKPQQAPKAPRSSGPGPSKGAGSRVRERPTKASGTDISSGEISQHSDIAISTTSIAARASPQALVLNPIEKQEDDADISTLPRDISDGNGGLKGPDGVKAKAIPVGAGGRPRALRSSLVRDKSENQLVLRSVGAMFGAIHPLPKPSFDPLQYEVPGSEVEDGDVEEDDSVRLIETDMKSQDVVVDNLAEPLLTTSVDVSHEEVFASTQAEATEPLQAITSEKQETGPQVSLAEELFGTQQSGIVLNTPEESSQATILETLRAAAADLSQATADDGADDELQRLASNMLLPSSSHPSAIKLGPSEVPAGKLQETENATEQPSNQVSALGAMDHSGVSNSLSLPAVPEIRPQLDFGPYSFRKRSYLQYKPYTVDKRQHAMMFKGRNSSAGVGRSQTRELRREDSLLIDRQDDDEDSDYEDREVQEDLGVEERYLSIPVRPRIKNVLERRSVGYMGALLEELDQDGLPTIEELRRQFQPVNKYTSQQKAMAPRAVGLSNLVDAESENLDLTLDPLSDGSQARSPSSERSLPEENGDSQEDATMQQDSFGSNDHEIELTTKKHRKIRQHVLPASFFKRNQLPDNPAELRSMRSKWRRSESPDGGATSAPEPELPAHHAKRRVVRSKQDDGSLKNFMAQLGQEQSESEDDFELSAYSRARQPSIGDFFDEEDSGSRPILRDTEAFRDHPLPRRVDIQYHRRAGQDPNREGLNSSDSDQEGSQSEGGEKRGWERSNSLPARSPALPKNGVSKSYYREPDLIDRMIVRTARNSSKSSSKKRRRVSGNSPSTKMRPSGNTIRVSRPRKPTLQYGSRDSQDTDDERDFAPSRWSGGIASDGDLRARAGADAPRKHGYTLHDYFESGDYDIDQDFMDTGLPLMLQGHGSRLVRFNDNYPAPQYGPTAPRYNPRKPVRKTVPRTRQSRSARRPSAHPRPRISQPKAKKQQAESLAGSRVQPHVQTQDPVYAALRSWFPHEANSAPQRRLRRQSALRRNQVARPALKKPRADPVQDGENSSSPQGNAQHVKHATSTDHDTVPDLPWRDEEDISASLSTAMQLKRKRVVLEPRSIYDAAHAREDAQSNEAISNGLYFSRDSYIGRGILSRLLRTISSRAQEEPADTDTTSNMVFFGQPFVVEWESSWSIERSLGDVVLNWKQLFRSIQEGAQNYDSGAVSAGFDASIDVGAGLLALENMTVVLIERFAIMPFIERGDFWRVFRTTVVDPLTELIETLQTERSQALGAILLLWTRWALLSWNILADCLVRDESDAVDRMTQKLLAQLLDASDKSYLERLAISLDPLRGAIHGQDVLEVWVCLIRVLNRHSDVSAVSQGFWVAFNQQLQWRWIKDDQPSDNGDQDPALTAQVDQANYVLKLLQQVCRLHQFEKDGSSNSLIRPSDNWELVLWLLNQKWLEWSPSGNKETSRHVRRFLTFCHSRIQAWDWGPSAGVVMHLCRYFAKQGYRDMPTETGHRLPEFLKRMIATPPNPPQTEPQHSPGPPLLTSFDPNMAFVVTVDENDRCFEILLKIVAKTIRLQLSAIDLDKDVPEAFQTPTAVSQGELKGGLLSHLTPRFRHLSKSEKLKTCKRMISSISPVMRITISVSGSSEYTYSSLCNLCNLVLAIDLQVPDSVRASSVGQMKGLLNFEGSDDMSRKMLLEAIFYLGTIWQRQEEPGAETPKSRRTLDKILDYFFERLENFGKMLADEVTTADNGTAGYVFPSQRQGPIIAMIENIFGCITRLLRNEKNLHPDHVPFPNLAFLDRRLGRFLDPDVAYPMALRMQALGIIEQFLALRKAHGAQVREAMAKEAKLVAAAAAATAVKPALVYDDFSWLDDDRLALDDGDLTEQQQAILHAPSQPLQQASKVSAPSITTADTTAHVTALSDDPIFHPQDTALVSAMLSWVYPTLKALVVARHDALYQQQQMPPPSTTPSFARQQMSSNPFAAKAGAAQQHVASPPTAVQPRPSNVASMSRQSAGILLCVYADCAVILMEQQQLQMHDILGQRGPFFRAGKGPSVYHWKEQDELVWATRVAEAYPRMLREHEDAFLRVWFTSITVPIEELTIQHRFLRAFLNVADSFGADSSQLQASNLGLCRHLFKNLPITLRDGNDGQMSEHREPGRLDQDSKLFQELRQSRSSLLAQVLANMEEHFMVLRAPLTVFQASAVQGRYWSYLELLLNQLRADYKRLEWNRMVPESMRHIEFAHYVVQLITQRCALILHDSELVRRADSVLGFFMSSQDFPQPPMDSTYALVRMRGYAYRQGLKQRGVFREVLKIIFLQLKAIPGTNDLRFEWPPKTLNQSTTAFNVASRQASSRNEGIAIALGLSFTYGHMTIPFHNPEHSDKQAAAALAKEEFERSLKSKTGWNAATPLTPPSPLPTGLPGAGNPVTGSNSSFGGTRHAQGGPALGSDYIRQLCDKPWVTVMQTLFAHQDSRLRQSLHVQWNEALQTLIKCMLNAGPETGETPIWNMDIRPFRYKVFICILGPLLTGFLGPQGDQGYCATLYPIDDGFSKKRAGPQRPRLMTVSVSAMHWVTALIPAMLKDVDSFSAQESPHGIQPAGNSSAGQPEEQPARAAVDGFIVGAAMLFAPLLQSLTGCLDLISTEWLQRVRARLGDFNLYEDEADRFMEDSKDALRALYLFGQTLQAIGAIAAAARKLRSERYTFYAHHVPREDALMQLVQFALDNGLFLMMSLGGPMEDGDDTPEIFPASQLYTRFMNILESDHSIKSGRVPGAQDAAAMEEAFEKKFMPGQMKVDMIQAMVHRELQGLTELEQWPGDILSSVADPARMSDGGETEVGRDAPQPQQRRQHPHQQQQHQQHPQLRKHHWALWSFQSSFFDFCQSISALDEFHGQVKRARIMLMKKAPAAPSNREGLFAPLQTRRKYLWHDLVHHAPAPGSPCGALPFLSAEAERASPPLQQQKQSWAILRFCMSREWRVFLAESRVPGPSTSRWNGVQHKGSMVELQQPTDVDAERLSLPGMDSIFL